VKEHSTFFNSSCLASNRGVTLIELIIALALLSTVLGMGYSFFSFGNLSFNKGEDQSNIQRDIRLFSDFITNQVRYSTEVELLDSIDSPLLEGYNYIYLNDKTLTYNTEPKTDNNINNVSFSLNKLNDQLVLNFLIQGSEESQNYEILSDTLLLNYYTDTGVLPVDKNVLCSFTFKIRYPLNENLKIDVRFINIQALTELF